MSAFKALGLDPKMYQHVKSDDKSTTIKHKQGHIITLAHNVLSPKMQTQLKALANIGKENQTNVQAQEAQDQKPRRMAEGGEAKQPESKSLQHFKQIKEQSPHVSREQIDTMYKRQKQNEYYKGIQKKADGGIIPYDEVSNYAEGTPDQPVAPDDNAPQIPPYLAREVKEDIPVETSPEVKQKEEDSTAKMAGKALGKAISENPRIRMADMALKGIGQGIQAAPGVASDFFSGLTNPTGQQAPPTQQQDEQQPAPDMGQSPDSVATPKTPPPPPDPVTQAMQNSQNMMDSAYREAMAGNTKEAQVQSQQAKEEQRQLQDNFNIQGRAQAAYQGEIQKLDSQYSDIRHDIEQGHIDPEKYWKGDAEGNGGHSKIMAGLGMILAGFNPTNNPNAAINFLKYQMDKNIEAQSKNLDAKNNLLRANLEQYRNKTDAFNATRLQQADILANQMRAIAAKNADPMAQARLLQHASEIDRTFAPLKQDFAMKRAMMSFMNGTNNNNPSDTRAAEHIIGMRRAMGDFKGADEMASYVVPGVGMSRTGPVSQANKDKIVAYKQTNDVMNQIQEFSKKHAGSLDPRVRAQGQALFNEFQSALRTAEDQGVYKKSDAEFLRETTGRNPASPFAKFSTDPKIRELQQLKQNEYNYLLKTNGLPEQQLPQPNLGNKNQTREAAAAWAKANPNDPRTAKILQSLGQ